MAVALGFSALWLPAVIGFGSGMLALIAICGGLGYPLSMLAAIDPLTAALAASAGGVDCLMIAANGKVDAPLVVARPTARPRAVRYAAPTWLRPLPLKGSRA